MPRVLLMKRLSHCQVQRSDCPPSPSFGPVEVQRTEMLNGIKVAAAKTTGMPMTACTIMFQNVFLTTFETTLSVNDVLKIISSIFQAGSRYETNDDLGASHFLRAMSSTSGGGYTSFSKMRVLQQRGAYLSTSSNRQTISFTLRCPLDAFAELKYYLLDTAVGCCYNEWDVSDQKALVREDNLVFDPEQRVLDLVQRACWAGSLANSTFCEEDRIDSMTGEKLRNFVDRNFKTTTCYVSSAGVPFDETLKLAEKIGCSRTPASQTETPCKPRGGFEYHDSGPADYTWLAAAVPGCGTRDFADLLKHAIISSACGTGNIYMGQHELHRIPQSPLGVMTGGDIFTDFKCFNISYQDAGVFGIVGKTKSCSARKAAIAATQFLSHIGELKPEHVEVGKRRLKLGLAQHYEDCAKVSEGLALQLANNVLINNEREYFMMIDKITSNDILSAAKNLMSKSKHMAVAALGDLNFIPPGKELLKK